MSTVLAESILNVLSDARHELHRMGVRRIGLFGSAVRDELHPDSDLDFLVELDKNRLTPTWTSKSSWRGFSIRRVDLVLADAIKPQLRDRILGEAVCPGTIGCRCRTFLRRRPGSTNTSEVFRSSSFVPTARPSTPSSEIWKSSAKPRRISRSPLRAKSPQIPWPRIAGLRDLLIHAYFGVDLDIIWDVVQNKLPALKVQVSELIADAIE